MEFSEKLKSLRNEKGISQQELADAIFVSRSAVAKWENGLGLPCDESLTLLCEYLGVEKEDLVSENETATVQKNQIISKYKKMLIALCSGAAIFVVSAIVVLSLFFGGAFASTDNRIPFPEEFPFIMVDNVSADSYTLLNPPPEICDGVPVISQPINEEAAALPLLEYKKSYAITLPYGASLNSVKYYFLNDDYSALDLSQEYDLSSAPLEHVRPAAMWSKIYIFETSFLYPEKDEVRILYLQNDFHVIILEFNYELRGYKAISHFRVER